MFFNTLNSDRRGISTLKSPSVWLAAGVILLAFVLVTSGFSWLTPLQIETSGDAVELFSQDGLTNPFAEFPFSFVSPTGITLYYDNSDNISDWVMVGELDGMMIPFILPDDGSGVEPDFTENVTYLLRYPKSENRALIEQINDMLFGFLRDEFGYTRADYDGEFLPTVFEEAQSSRVTNIVLVVIGIAALGVGLILLGMNTKKRAANEFDVTSDAGGGFVVQEEGNTPFTNEKKDDPWD